MSRGGIVDAPVGLRPGPATKVSVIALTHGNPTVAEKGLPGPELRAGLEPPVMHYKLRLPTHSSN